MITLDQVRETAQAVADQYPTRTNEGVCKYSREDETPHCFVAVIADRLGVDVPLPGTADNKDDVARLCTPGRMWDGVFTPEAVDYLAATQFKADYDEWWSDCVPQGDGA